MRTEGRAADDAEIAAAGITVVGRPSLVTSLGTSVAVVATATGIGLLLPDRQPDIVALYLLGVVVVAARLGNPASILTVALAVGAFDFFFTPPYFSFRDDDRRYLVTYAVMLCVGLVIGDLTMRTRRAMASARARAFRNGRLYAMSREVSTASSSDEVVAVVCRHLRAIFPGEVFVLRVGPSGLLSLGSDGRTLSPDVLHRAREVVAGVRTGPGGGPAAGERILPVVASRGTIGVLVIQASVRAATVTAEGQELLEAFASQLALALERAQIAEEREREHRQLLDEERLRNALLSSVSHDLRTPLAVVVGSVSAALEGEAPEEGREHLETALSAAEQLNLFLRNVLDMTTLEAQALRARKDWQSLEEVIGTALGRLDEALHHRRIAVTIPGDAMFVPCDARLLEQVLVNLVDNAAKYTPPGSPIEVRSRAVPGGVEVEVCDRGPGVPLGQEEAIFEKFRRGPLGGNGMGLGLTICRGIITCHGGTIRCENRPDGGARFSFVLPREGDPPPTPELPGTGIEGGAAGAGAAGAGAAT
jgi:two-component system sensor histidine kinase KdpD